jgi:hypothetical protein
MFQMPLLAIILYIATRVHFDGHMIDDNIVALFGRAALHLTAREIDVASRS